EATGNLSNNDLNVYLTDGGHVENLGIYELLRRRCKVVVAVDMDMDPNLTFPSLVNLEVMARIDLGVRLDLPWAKLQESAVAVTAEKLRGKEGFPGGKGPHACALAAASPSIPTRNSKQLRPKRKSVGLDARPTRSVTPEYASSAPSELRRAS